ncbi:Zinc finger, CCHC-type [Sesbania bispinosa]|nr:Zinc finger, CCHC-type [Sesbania bispinosa]
MEFNKDFMDGCSTFWTDENCESNRDESRNGDGNPVGDQGGLSWGGRMIHELTHDDIRRLEFASKAEAYSFYSDYAKQRGFAVRKDDIERNENGDIVKRYLVCNKEGTRDKKNLERKDRVREARPITRVQCIARMRVYLDMRSGKWKVSSFHDDHNHELTPPTYVHMMPAYRRLSESDKAQIDTLHAAGVRTCHIMSFMIGQKGGHGELGFCKKDMYNHIDKQKRANIEDGDAFAALCYLQGKYNGDPLMHCMFRTTDDGRLQDLFWCDGASRVDYQCFGDVIAFDMTYKKNKYNKPLVIFYWYNHHGETCIFGCALVVDEKTETYKWVLETFLEAMFGKEPSAVVTDGDAAMREAIRVVFPSVVHRLCSWHIHQNACENVKNSKFLEEFKRMIYGKFTEDRFEREWTNMVDKFGLSNNRWVQKMYDMKRLWANSYMGDTFYGGVRTTSVCEGINSFIKRALKEYRHNELISDFKSFYGEPVLTTTLFTIEECASKVFTRKKFWEVKSEIESAAAYNVVDRVVTGETVRLTMNKFCKPDYEYDVVLDKSELKFNCECRMFESCGIPCRHIFCAMKNEHVKTIPSSLILKRWTKSAKPDFMSSEPVVRLDKEKVDMLREGEVVKTKGAPRKSRRMMKGRRCSNCRRRGHTKNKCPGLSQRDILGDAEDDESSWESDGAMGNDKGEVMMVVFDIQGGFSWGDDLTLSQRGSTGTSKGKRRCVSQPSQTSFDRAELQGLHDKVGERQSKQSRRSNGKQKNKGVDGAGEEVKFGPRKMGPGAGVNNVNMLPTSLFPHFPSTSMYPPPPCPRPPPYAPFYGYGSYGYYGHPK